VSDRIDELVAICTEQMNACNGCPNLLVIHELATIARDEWKKPRSCPSCGEYMVHIDTAEIVQQETAEYVLRAREAEAMCKRLVDIAASHAVAANLLRERETRDEYKARLLKAASEEM
jgi:hypothetical protein